MIGLIPLYFSSFAVALSGALIPGPMFTTTVSESIKRGPIAGPLIVSGHILLETVLVIACVIGLTPLLQKDIFFITVSFIGAAILVWLGIGMFRGLSMVKLDMKVEKGGRKNLMVTGILLSIGNPFWVIWWATIGLGFIAHAQKAGLSGVLVFYSGHITADFLWFTFLSTLVGKGRRFISDRVYQIIIGVCGVILFGFAAFFIGSGINRFQGIL